MMFSDILINVLKNGVRERENKKTISPLDWYAAIYTDVHCV